MNHILTLIIAIGACGCGAVFGVIMTNAISRSFTRARVAYGVSRCSKLRTSITDLAISRAKQFADDGVFQTYVAGGGLLIGEPGGIKYSNGYLESILGRGWEDIRGHRWQSLVHHDDLMHAFQAIQSPKGTMIIRWRSRSGTWCYVSFAWEREVESQVTVAVVHDVTNFKIRRKAEEVINSIREEISGVHQILKF